MEANCPDEEELILEFIDPCLTFSYQSSDIEFSGLPQKMVRVEYHNHVAKLFSTFKQSANIEAEDNIPVFLEEFAGFPQKIKGKINSVNRKIDGYVNIQHCNSVIE